MRECSCKQSVHEHTEVTSIFISTGSVAIVCAKLFPNAIRVHPKRRPIEQTCNRVARVRCVVLQVWWLIAKLSKDVVESRNGGDQV